MAKPDPVILKAVVDVQAQTPCRKCKGKDWTMKPEFGDSHGGQRVGVFIVMGPPTDAVSVVTFQCNGCSAKFPRPVYTKKQLADQQFPAVQLDAKLEPEPEAEPKATAEPKTARQRKTGRNGR